jgi:hypothetical protein
VHEAGDGGDEDDDTMLPAGTVEARSLTRVAVTQARSGRVTIEWTLDGQPAPEWIEVFDAASERTDFRATVSSAYGRPLVMLDGVVIWSVTEDQIRAALRVVADALADTDREFRRRRPPLASAWATR